MSEEIKPVEPVLRERDVTSETWKRLRAHLEARLAKLRQANDSMTLGGKATAAQRGRIAEIKGLLALEFPPPTIPNEDANFKD